MTLIRVGDATVLHYKNAQTPAALCGAVGDIVRAATRDDLLCGSCQDELDWLSLTDAERRQIYGTYMKSGPWAHIRAIALEHYGAACLLCGNDNPDELNVHHRSYARLGRERLADLAILCRDCHAAYHGKAA